MHFGARCNALLKCVAPEYAKCIAPELSPVNIILPNLLSMGKYLLTIDKTRFLLYSVGKP